MCGVDNFLSITLFSFFPSYVHRYQLFVLDVTNNGSEKCNAAAYCLHYFAHGCCQQSSFSLHEYAKKRMTSKEIEAKVAFYLAPRWCRKKRLEKSLCLLTLWLKSLEENKYSSSRDPVLILVFSKGLAVSCKKGHFLQKR